MSTRQQIAHETARALRAADPAQLHAFVGFDGFVDDILEVVAQRHSAERYDRIETMAAFGTLISSAAGQGCNVELVSTRQKLGGNSPIMGNALANLGLPVTCVGALGDDASPMGIHPVFRDFSRKAELIPITPAARTHALEFADGKLMMGQLQPLSRMTYEALVGTVGKAALAGHLEKATLIGLLNWTMLPYATDLWRKLGTEILPHLSKKPRRIFVDLADPKKRPRSDLSEAMSVLADLNSHAPVTLGLNGPEAAQVAAACGVDASAPPTALAQALRTALKLDTVVIHYTASAAGATPEAAAEFPGPHCAKPRILTGAGDHFNAGFALGQLLRLPLESALCLATATSGYYVRQAESPSAEQLAAFLESLPS